MNIQKIMTKVVSLMAVAILYVASTASVVANQNDAVILYLNDPLGSAIAAYDENGDVCWEETHTPYGDKTVLDDSFNRPSCGVIIEERGFTGHTDDYETDLVYMQQRYYDPTIGRFLSTDPVGPKVGSPISINRYSYAANNPYKYVDPNGEEPITATIALGYGVVAVGVAFTATETYSTYRREGVGAAAKTLAIGALASAAGGKLAVSAVKYRSKFTSLFKSTNDVPNSAANAARRLGVNLDNIPINNGVARTKIELSSNLNPKDINQLKDVLSTRGATRVEVDTGFIANEKLDGFLRRRVQDGKPFNGGTVRLGNSKDSDFTIDFDL